MYPAVTQSSFDWTNNCFILTLKLSDSSCFDGRSVFMLDGNDARAAVIKSKNLPLFHRIRGCLCIIYMHFDCQRCLNLCSLIRSRDFVSCICLLEN